MPDDERPAGGDDAQTASRDEAQADEADSEVPDFDVSAPAPSRVDDDFARADTDPGLGSSSAALPPQPRVKSTLAVGSDALADTHPVLPMIRRIALDGEPLPPAETAADGDDVAEDAPLEPTSSLEDTVDMVAPASLSETLGVPAGAEQHDVVEHTRELPVLRAEELWFVHDRPPPALGPGHVFEIDGREVLILSCIGVQTFERRYRVRIDGQRPDLLLKQGALGAPFVRYALEARAIEEVHAESLCPGLPSIYLQWQDDSCQYLVTDLPSGRPFVHLLDEGSLSPVQRVHVLQALTRLVQRLHNAGYILTSLRPTSFDVELDARGAIQNVYLTDLLNLCETVERPPYPLASPFTAPEITEQAPADESADIYSIGALLYRIVTGRDVPARRHGNGLFVPQVPEAQTPMVFQVLARTLSAPSERFFDVRDLERALEQLRHELEPRLRVNVAMRSSTGINPLRTVNQDSGAFQEVRRVHRTVQTHLGFYCVADGMGGHEDGDRASELATEGAMRAFQQLVLELRHETWRDSIAHVCKRIAAAGSRHLVDTIRSEGGGRRMGTTFTAVLVVDELVSLAHLGDSRAILFRDDRLEVLSEDHSLVGMMVKAGQMTIEQAERADEKNILMRSLGADHPVRAELFDGFETTLGSAIFTARAGDRLILVSDGVWGMITRPQMAEIFRRHRGADALCDALCNEAIRRGGGDNVVVLALDFEQLEPGAGRSALGEETRRVRRPAASEDGEAAGAGDSEVASTRG